MDDDHFTHSNMELLLMDDNNNNSNNMINPTAASLRNNFSSLSNVVSRGHEEFTPNLPGNNFTILHQSESCGLPFIPLPSHATNNNNPSFDFSGDHHQAAASFNDPIATHLADDHMIKRTSATRDEIISLGNSNPRPNFISRENYKTNRNNHQGHGAGKRRKKNMSEAEVLEKPREVVHVRARRGEATDSHSLAERLRREKINGKLRSLQELVPGCYKTMGMSVMLDITISYIRSLQNQIEFLSMKLSAASMFYDFNSAEMDAFDTLRGANGYEAQVMGGEGYGSDQLLQFQSTWPL